MAPQLIKGDAPEVQRPMVARRRCRQKLQMRHGKSRLPATQIEEGEIATRGAVAGCEHKGLVERQNSTVRLAQGREARRQPNQRVRRLRLGGMCLVIEPRCRAGITTSQRGIGKSHER